MLYRPTVAEIDAIIHQGITKQPHLTERYQRARDILLDDGLFTIHDDWYCASQTTSKLSYTVNGACTCPDYQKGGGTIQGHIFCKHRLALEAYRHLLEGHLEQRLMGNAKFRIDLDRSRLSPNTYLLQLWETNRLGTHLDHGRLPQPICSFRWAKRGRTFASDADLAHFATWLATAQPLPDTALLSDPMAQDADIMDYHAWRNHWFVTKE
jgi:hypothetical protein